MTLEERTELIYRIALARIKGMDITAVRHYEALGISAKDFFTLPTETLARLGVGMRTIAALRSPEIIETSTREAAWIEASNIKAIYHSDTDYPEMLRECPDAPAMIFCLGATTMPRNILAIVGTRHATSYGVDFTRRLIKDLAAALPELMIVSGLAYGIDVAAHKAALAEGVPTAAVLAHPLNTIYPADHRDVAKRMVAEGGALITEYTTSEAVHRGNFLARNRLVAGISQALVVVESDRQGGAMTTARLAMDYNRDVFALPGRVGDTYSRGTNALIASHQASLIRDAGDLLEVTGWQCNPVEGKQQELLLNIPEDYGAIIDTLAAHPEATINDLCTLLGQSYSRISALVSEMELNDYLTILPGGRFSIVKQSR